MVDKEGKDLALLVCGRDYKKWYMDQQRVEFVEQDEAGAYIFKQLTDKYRVGYVALRRSSDVYSIVYKEVEKCGGV